jgi:hypothetical protein
MHGYNLRSGTSGREGNLGRGGGLRSLSTTFTLSLNATPGQGVTGNQPIEVTTQRIRGYRLDNQPNQLMPCHVFHIRLYHALRTPAQWPWKRLDP